MAEITPEKDCQGSRSEKAVVMKPPATMITIQLQKRVATIWISASEITFPEMTRGTASCREEVQYYHNNLTAAW
jgi:hypothetical protein